MVKLIDLLVRVNSEQPVIIDDVLFLSVDRAIDDERIVKKKNTLVLFIEVNGCLKITTYKER